MEQRGIREGATDEATYVELADLFIDISRELRARAALRMPVVPLTQTQAQVMRFVHDHPGCSASDIADGTGLQRANVSVALRDLRRRDYITSRKDPTDGRAIRIEATPRADATIAALRRSWADIVAEAWRSEAPDDEASVPPVVIDALIRIRAGLGAEHAMNAFATDPPRGGASSADSTVPSVRGTPPRDRAATGSHDVSSH